MKKQIEVFNLQLLGRCQIDVATHDSKEVDINRHRAATAPNLYSFTRCFTITSQYR